VSARKDLTFEEFVTRVNEWLWHYSSLEWGNLRTYLRKQYVRSRDPHAVAVNIMSTDGKPGK
jgi:hypothetical protein